jgi:hypothetical protein
MRVLVQAEEERARDIMSLTNRWDLHEEDDDEQNFTSGVRYVCRLTAK